MTHSLSLDPLALPMLDIVNLANRGTIIRAELETPENGVPAFITAAGWHALQALHGTDTHDRQLSLLRALERAVHRLLSHAADTMARSKQKTFDPVMTCTSDLFEPEGMLQMAFVRDRTHPVACMLVDTPDHLRELLARHHTSS